MPCALPPRATRWKWPRPRQTLPRLRNARNALLVQSALTAKTVLRAIVPATPPARAAATSPATAPAVTVVLANGRRPGVWVDGDPVGRTEANLAAELLPGPWRWRLGAGEYEGRETDRFGGTVTRLRAWA